VTARTGIPIARVEDVERLVGQELGPADWFVVEQEAVDRFAAIVRDPQWIHVDVERAARSAFGGTIAHGYLVLALGPGMLRQILDLRAVTSSVNYGCNRVRFPAPSPVGARLRMWLRIAGLARLPDGCRVTLDYRFEREHGERPVCVAQAISQWTFARERRD
jgi:acyl dehydratase